MHLLIALLLVALQTLAGSPSLSENQERGTEAPRLLPGSPKHGRSAEVKAEWLAAASARPGARLTIELFPGEPWRLTTIRATPAWGGGVVYTADVTDASKMVHGTASFSVFGEAISGNVRLGKRLVRLETDPRGGQRFVEVDELALPSCPVQVRHPAEGMDSAASVQSTSSSALVSAAEPATLDLLVVYTEEARAAHGGTPALLASINLAVNRANQTYVNSDVELELRLVHVAEVTGYVETGDFPTDLNRLQNPWDGNMDEVHALRDQYGADAVTLVVASTQWCGMAIVGGAPNHVFEFWAFNLVSHVCLDVTWTLAHELGHNMGSDHNVEDAVGAPGFPFFPFAYGWHTANNAWRTVMDITPGPKAPYFSNPNKTHAGAVMGLPDLAENWRSLNLNAPTAAQWRCAVPEPYGTAKLASNGQLPGMSWCGRPVSNGSGDFELRVENGLPGAPAICFFGFAPDDAPFVGGTRWVAGPIQRLPLQFLDANGDASFALPQLTRMEPGEVLYVQAWFRDPAHPDGTGSGLTDGLRVDVCEFDQ